jgi:adenosylmethionine---8-amino-7-oxononanoate aminotransferase
MKSVWHPCTQMKHHETTPLIPIKKGRGSWLFDFNNKKYLDVTSSWWVNLFGHNNKIIKKYIKNQIDQLEHSMISGLTHEPVIELSEKLNNLTGLGHCSYGSDGANAVEIALKMSSHFWRQKAKLKKTKFVYLKNSYHGETLGALSVTDIPLFKNQYSQIIKNHIQVDSPDWRKGKNNESPKEIAKNKLLLLKKMFEKKHSTISSIILEPLVQCATGMAMYDKEYLVGIRKLCNQYEIHLIVDEIAVGFGRTGKIFAHHHAKIKPDFLCLSKGLTAGYLPLSVTLTTDKIYNAFYDNDIKKGFLHSHSYTGNPLACSAALGMLSIFESNDVLLENRNKAIKINLLLENYKNLPIKDLRNIGMIWAFELDLNIDISKVTSYCVSHGLLIRPIGNTIYFMPPYSLNDSEIKHMISITEQGIKQACI